MQMGKQDDRELKKQVDLVTWMQENRKTGGQEHRNVDRQKERKTRK